MRRIDIGEQVRVAAGAHRTEPRGFSGRVIAKRGDRVQVSTGSYGGQDHGVWVDIADVTQGPSGNPSGDAGHRERVAMIPVVLSVLQDHAEPGSNKHALGECAADIVKALSNAGFGKHQ